MKFGIKTALAILVSFHIFSGSYAEAGKDYFQQFVHYTIKARLDAEKHMLTGNEEILYVNNSPDTLSILYLHLYPNAYRSKNSALIKDYRRKFNFTLLDVPKANRSYLDLFNVSADGKKLKVEVDDTIAGLPLPSPLLPGDSLTIKLDFKEKIRRHLGRAGYKGRHYDMAQWYPKMVVYDEKGFHPDKFRTGEFYGEFGTFDVFLDIPADMVVAATGTLVSGDPGWDYNDENGRENRNKPDKEKRKTVHFRADNVHDFAWCVDPGFVVQDTTWNNVEIRSFYRKTSKDWKDSTLVHGVRALKWLSEKIGPYPYPSLNIVDALLSGGMEYPMLVMNARASEGLVLHEVGHIYFYGIFGNDERAEAWLDEGFTTFQTIWYFEEKYGPWGKRDRWDFYHKMTPQYSMAERRRKEVFDLQRLKYAERIATRAEAFKHSYRANVYSKAALMFRALKYTVGDDVFGKILHEYFRRWKFKHVNEKRFREVCEEEWGGDLGWFFKQWLHSTKACDYRLDSVESTKDNETNSYKVNVRIKRIGEIVMPLRLELIDKDGGKETFGIDGRLRTIEKTFNVKTKPVAARLNPRNSIMDMNLSDNFIPRLRKLQFDWPNNDYYPENAYQIRYRPGLWYNDIDGLKAGLHLRGSRTNWSRRFELGVYYGFESERVDFSVKLSKSLRFMGNNGWATLEGYKMEGRRSGTLSINLRRRKNLLNPPNHDFLFGLSYHELANSRFADPEEYEEGVDVGPFLGYYVDPEIDIMSTSADLRIKLGREWAGGKFKYERFRAVLKFKSRRQLIPVSLRLRIFAGFIGGSMPYQQKFHLAGAGPLQKEKLFYLRSPGAVPKDLNYHEGGDGNLRGYQAGDFGVNQLLAMNFEIGFPLPLPLVGKMTRKILGRLEYNGFIDLGRSLDDANPIATSERTHALVEQGVLEKVLLDAGVGLRASKSLPFIRLTPRLDFPFYVNHPELNGEKDKTAYRYVFSLGASF